MKVAYIIVGAVLVLVVLLLPIALAIFSPSSSSWLVNVRDMSIIYSSLFMCVGALLFIATTAILGFIAFQIREHIVPALQKVDDTARTVKGTATFVSESVVSPIIKVAGAAAGAKAMVQTLVRKDANPKPNGKNGKNDKSDKSDKSDKNDKSNKSDSSDNKEST